MVDDIAPALPHREPGKKKTNSYVCVWTIEQEIAIYFHLFFCHHNILPSKKKRKTYMNYAQYSIVLSNFFFSY